MIGLANGSLYGVMHLRVMRYTLSAKIYLSRWEKKAFGLLKKSVQVKTVASPTEPGNPLPM